MKIKNFRIHIKTKGAGDFVNITDKVADALLKIGNKNGLVIIFVIG